MTSSDHELLIAINGEIRAIRKDIQVLGDRVTRIEDTVAEMRTDMNNFDRRLVRIEDKVDSLQTSVYWVLAAIGIFLAAIAIMPQIRKNTPAPQPEAPAMPIPPLQPITIYTYAPENMKKGLD